MKACHKCGFIGETSDCIPCGTPLGDILFRSESDIFIRTPDLLRHTADHTGISAFGLHVGCRGCVHKNQSSSGMVTLTCIACYLRVVTDEPFTPHNEFANIVIQPSR